MKIDNENKKTFSKGSITLTKLLGTCPICGNFVYLFTFIYDDGVCYVTFTCIHCNRLGTVLKDDWENDNLYYHDDESDLDDDFTDILNDDDL